MFTYVSLKNFLSFGDITFNFKKNSSDTKRFVAIYGENGSGKSNFVRSIELLHRTLVSFDFIRQADIITDLIEKQQKKKRIPQDIIRQMLQDTDMSQYISSCRTIDCEEPTIVEYGFVFDGYEGIYRLEFSDKFTHESLYYFTGKQRGYLFDISSDSDERIIPKFYSGLFLDNKVRNEMIDEIKKYWGKHTFLSIIRQQIDEKNLTYIRESISRYLLSVTEMLMNITVISKSGNRHNFGIISSKPDTVMEDLRSGVIRRSEIDLLRRSERILREFFTQSYADIKDVVYEFTNISNDNIRYQLYVDKMIAGKIRRISFENESAGTQQILEIVRTLLGLFCGVTVVYDEIDNGIHDILLNQIISSLVKEINGQLIITTHNTMLLEAMDPHSAYVIQVDYLGNKEAHCMTEYSVQSNNNMRIKYIKGLFGGTPYVDGIDYESISRELNGDKGAE